MLARGEAVQVAVSGGVDSMVLAHVLRALGHPVSIFHVDHGLRDAESDQDRAFVEAFANASDIPFNSVVVDVRGKHAEGGSSIQMAARELRYAAFKRCVENGGAIALGHHRDDAVETLLLNLMRGTGAAGLAGIPAVTPIGVGRAIRPLLGVGRAEIMEYAVLHGIPFREDSSNASTKYLRNRIRNEVLPLLEDVRPGALRAMGRSLDILSELVALGQAFTREQERGPVRDADGAVHVPFRMLEPHASPRLLLHALLADDGVHPDAVGRILAAVHGRSVGARFRIGGTEALVERDELVLSKAQRTEEERPVLIAEDAGHAPGFSWRFVDADEVDPGKGMRTAWLDADRLSFPLTLRPWQQGDRMRPLGGGGKLISDILTDAKVPHLERDRIRVLLSGGSIVWLVGHRIGDGAQATATSRQVFRIDAV